MAEPLFGHEGSAELASLGDREVAGSDTFDDDRTGILRQPLAGQCGKEFVLAVTGDAGDAEDLAALQLERDVLQPHAVRHIGLEAEVVDDEAVKQITNKEI